MTIDTVIFGFLVYFIGLILSAGYSIFYKQWERSVQLFVVSNLFGFVAGIFYLINFSTKTIVLFEWKWFFSFAPTMGLLNGIFFTLIAGVSALIGVYSFKYLEFYEKIYNSSVVQFLTTLFVLGMQGVFLANNSFSFLFFWEIMSIVSFFLVMSEGTSKSVRAGFLYFIMTHLGAAAIMGGFLVLSGGSLIFDFQNIGIASSRLSPQLLAFSFGLFFFGFGSKAGLVPFHIWLPEAHPEAPSNISAMMSGLMLKVAVYGFIRIIFALSGLPAWAGSVVVVLGILSAIAGVLFSAIERDIKRAFAYSSIENLGIIFTMLGTALFLISQNVPQATEVAFIILVFAIFLAINHALFKTALFLSSGVIMNRFHSKSLEMMGGLAKVMPWFSFVFLLSILGSLPIPFFGTFYGEWGFVENVVNLLHIGELNSSVFGMLLIILTVVGIVSGVAVVAMVKIFGISMLGKTRAKHLRVDDEKTYGLLLLPIGILSLLMVVLGIFSKHIIMWMMTQRNLLVNFSQEIGSTYPDSFSAVILVAFLFLCALLVYLINKYLTKNGSERVYHTWDCGQRINSTMEYTATAFSAPIRFFFLPLLGSRKYLESTPIVETNPWIRKYHFSLYLRSLWRDRIYGPVVNLLLSIAERLKIIQNGRVQYYLLFLFLTLIITLIVVL